jgi:hypothetical protein
VEANRVGAFIEEHIQRLKIVWTALECRLTGATTYLKS